MSEKLIESTTFKSTFEEKRKLEAIAKSRKLSLSELIRYCCMKEIQEVEELMNSLQNAFALTTDTRDTFELLAQPIDVTPQKIQAQKKPNCRNQLSLICHSTATL
ncbi:hypothetical protein [Acinetobacter gyllenbergii]|uniref:hypothetical protein n=1 Tax=Acinetobacter gyllenbergii TaxID=134534 RepID=UPI003AF951CC